MAIDLNSTAEHAARLAGKALRDRMGQNPGVLTDSGRDIKTEADLEAEARILEVLRPTGIPILAEESGLNGLDAPHNVCDLLKAEDPLWIVDPLDGTYNYVRGIPCSCVSIALWKAGHPVLGVIYDFHLDELWTGSTTAPTTCNHLPTKVSTVSDVSNALIATGFPESTDGWTEVRSGFRREISPCKSVRIFGSTAMALVYVARGWVDAYQDANIWIWDVAAGAALVEAAGGKVEWNNIQPNGLVTINAHNGHLT